MIYYFYHAKKQRSSWLHICVLPEKNVLWVISAQKAFDFNCENYKTFMDFSSWQAYFLILPIWGYFQYKINIKYNAF